MVIAPGRTGIAIYPQQENVILGQKGAVMFSCFSSWQHFSIAQTALSYWVVSLLEGEKY